MTGYVDGNAAAGALAEVFAVDVTSAVGQCSGCGRTEAFGAVRVYLQAPGLVARCPSCDTVLLRLVTTPTHTYLDLQGLTYLRLPPP
jgi:hypothetical protein